MFADGTIHGRLLAHASTPPHSNAFAPFYEASAARTLSDFDAAFGTGSQI